MFERFTDRVRKVIALANRQALRLGHPIIRTEHILLGLLEEGRGVGVMALRNIDIDLQVLASKLEQRVPPPESAPRSWWRPWTSARPSAGKLPQEQLSKDVIVGAIDQARRWEHEYVGTEHLLMGLLNVREGLAAKILTEMGVTSERAASEVKQLVRDRGKSASAASDNGSCGCDCVSREAEWLS